MLNIPRTPNIHKQEDRYTISIEPKAGAPCNRSRRICVLNRCMDVPIGKLTQMQMHGKRKQKCMHIIELIH